MPGRTHTNHRFSVNGMEKSPEIASGHNTSYFRELDARTGRWWSVDPVWQPWESPYATFGNNPILLADPSGDLPRDSAGKSKGKKDKGERKKERKERRANRRERWKNWAQGRQYINDAEDYIRDHGIDPSQVTRYEDEIRVGEYISKPTIITTDPDGTTSIYVDYDKVIRKFRRRPLKERLLDGLQNTLGAIGMIPVLGEAADLLDAGISALRGDYVGATLSLAAAVPIWGIVARSAKVGRGMLKAGRKGQIDNGFKAPGKTAPDPNKGLRDLARRPCGCFTAGTLVKTATGYKSIEKIVIGDTVWAFNDTTNVLALKEVTHIFRFTRDTLIRIQVGGQWIETTTDHPFFKSSWVAARYLQVGDSLVLYAGTKQSIDSIFVESGAFTVYNFTVEGFHTYFVSGQEVLVHNNDCITTVRDLARNLGEYSPKRAHLGSHFKQDGLTSKNGPAQMFKDDMTLEGLGKEIDDLLSDPSNAHRVVEGTSADGATEYLIDMGRVINKATDPNKQTQFIRIWVRNGVTESIHPRVGTK